MSLFSNLNSIVFILLSSFLFLSVDSCIQISEFVLCDCATELDTEDTNNIFCSNWLRVKYKRFLNMYRNNWEKIITLYNYSVQEKNCLIFQKVSSSYFQF